MWARIDDNFFFHPKVVAAGNGPVGAWVRALSYCASHYTGGFVPDRIASSISTPEEREILLETRLWRRVALAEACVIENRRDSGRRPLADVTVVAASDGYFIPDFLHYHPTREEAEAMREKRVSAGRTSRSSAPARASAQARAKAPAKASAGARAAAGEISNTEHTRPVLKGVKPSSSTSTEDVDDAADDDEEISREGPQRITNGTIAEAMVAGQTRSSVEDDDGLTSDLLDELRSLRPNDDQWNAWYAAATDEPDRVRACLAYARTNAKRRPVGLLDKLISNNSWPGENVDPRRSVADRMPYVCPHPGCGIGFKTEPALAEHLENVHAAMEAAPPPPEALAFGSRPSGEDDLEDGFDDEPPVEGGVS